MTWQLNEELVKALNQVDPEQRRLIIKELENQRDEILYLRSVVKEQERQVCAS